MTPQSNPEERPGQFELSWSGEHGYRVSVPGFLGHAERMVVVPASEYDRLREALHEIEREAAGSTSEDALKLNGRLLRITLLAREALS